MESTARKSTNRKQRAEASKPTPAKKTMPPRREGTYMEEKRPEHYAG